MYRPAWLQYHRFHTQRRLTVLLLAGFAVVLLALGIGLRDPWPADEPRYVLVAQEMLDTGQFLIPHRGGEIYPDKPPVFMWALAAAMALTGSTLGFLLPSLLAAVGTLWLVVDLCRRLYDDRIAILSGLALLGLFQFTLQAKSAQIDMLLTFWTTLGSYGILRHALLGPDRRWWYAGCAAMGLGVITKGVGFLPLLLLPGWYVLAKKQRLRPLAGRDLLLGLLVIVGVILLWLIPMVVYTTSSGDPALLAYRDNILLRQTVERYADSWGHIKPWYYFILEVVPWAWFPLVIALPWLAPAWWRRLRRLDARVLLPLGGLLLIILFFSLSPGKRGVYLLPTAPLLVLASAPLLPGLLGQRRLQQLASLALVIIGLACLAAGLLGLFDFAPLARLGDHYHVSPWGWWIALGIGAAVLLFRLRGIAALYIWLLVVWWGLWSTLGYLEMDHVRSPRDLMARAVGITGADAQLGLVDFDEEFLLHAQQPSVHFGYHSGNQNELRRAYAWLAERPRQRWLLVSQELEDLLDCVDSPQVYDLGFQNSEHWWLIPATATANCTGDANAAPLFVAPTTVKTD